MIDATDYHSVPGAQRHDTPSLPLPAPVPFGTPVLISDCMQPLAGETMLSLLWKRIEGSPEAD